MAVTRVHFEEQINKLRQTLLEMGAATEEMVRDAITALVEQDLSLAKSIITRDDKVDRMEQEIEAHCLRLIGLQQPVASDLRMISAALKVVTDIERIADHAVDISRIAERMGREMPYKPLVDVPRLGVMVRQNLHDALVAFVSRDVELLRAVRDCDRDVDALYREMTADLQTVMKDEPLAVLQASHLLFVAHYLERIGDHTVNIAERVLYAETGQ